MAHVGLTQVSEEPVSSTQVTFCGGVPIETQEKSDTAGPEKGKELTVDEVLQSILVVDDGIGDLSLLPGGTLEEEGLVLCWLRSVNSVWSPSETRNTYHSSDGQFQHTRSGQNISRDTKGY